MNQQTSEVVITKSVTISRPPEHAFRVFTDEIDTWWPLRTHAVDTKQAETVVLEGRVGGRLFERTAAGDEHVWGTVTVWEPPERVAYTWHPGRGAETAQQVEVTFSPDGTATRVELRHWGWEKLGDRLEEIVADYSEGWDLVIGRFAEKANA